MAIKKLPKDLVPLKQLVLEALNEAAIDAAQDEAKGDDSGTKGWEFFSDLHASFVGEHSSGEYSSRELAVVLKYLEDRGEIISSRRQNPYNFGKKGACYKLAGTKDFK